jgi:hypothetical protein
MLCIGAELSFRIRARVCSNVTSNIGERFFESNDTSDDSQMTDT